MRFQNKISDQVQIDQQLDQLALSTESSYLWTHHEGRLIIINTLLTVWDRDKRLLKFRLDKTVNKSVLKIIKSLNCFHEDLLNIFKCSIHAIESESIILKAPSTILKLADFDASNPTSHEELSEMDQSDLELITQVLQVINTDLSKTKLVETSLLPDSTSGYVFAKKPEIKETASSLAFSDKGVVHENPNDVLKESKQNLKTKRISLGRPGQEPSIYILNEVETHGVSFQTTVKNEFKVAESITVHSILDSSLSSPLTAKITVFNKPSEYAKYWYVEAKFDVSLNSPVIFDKPKEMIGVNRLLGEDQYSSEVFYQVEEINTQEVILIEKRKGEFKEGDKVRISTLYGNQLKKSIAASITAIKTTEKDNLITLTFVY